MALEIQTKLQLMLMVFENTFKLITESETEIEKEQFDIRADDMIQYYRELQQSIKNLDDNLTSDMPTHNLNELFHQRDQLIDEHKLKKRELEEISIKVDQKIVDCVKYKKN